MERPVVDRDTILIVDDEESVRRTFSEWLKRLEPPARILTARDAEEALLHAHQESIDLAVLDWNLGTGSDGLQLLEDLSLFHTEVVAILVTGYAHQATPLQALRLGVRDYIEKDQELNAGKLVAAVQKQLLRIKPARRQREMQKKLQSFRSALETLLELIPPLTGLQDVPRLDQSVGDVLKLVESCMGDTEAFLVVKTRLGHDAGEESVFGLRSDGTRIACPVPFSKSVAGLAATMQTAVEIAPQSGRPIPRSVQLQPFERARACMLAISQAPGEGSIATIELLNSNPDRVFGAGAQLIAKAAIAFAVDLLKQSTTEHGKSQVVMQVIREALSEHEAVRGEHANDILPQPVLERIRDGLSGFRDDSDSNLSSMRLADAIRRLVTTHGPEAGTTCERLIAEVHLLLDRNCIAGGSRP